MNTVTFNLDSKAVLVSGDLVQTVATGGNAVAPVIKANAGFVFLGWDAALTNITETQTITAVYKADSNIFALCEFIAEKIQANADLVSFCTETFAKQPEFFVGIDTSKLPEPNSIPFVVISPVSSQNQETTHLQQNIFIGVVCENDSKTTSSKITKYIGYRTIADFESTVFRSAQEAIDVNTTYYSLLSWQSVQYECYYPQFHASRELSIVCDF